MRRCKPMQHFGIIQEFPTIYRQKWLYYIFNKEPGVQRYVSRQK